MELDENQPIEFSVDNGVTIRGDAWGNPSDPPVIFLHGGGQTRHAWGSTAKEVTRKGWYAVAIDLRGHGDSDWDPKGDYSVDHFKQDLITISGTFSRQPAIVGASLGGMMGLVSQGETDEQFISLLILVDVTPRLEATGVERIVAFMLANPDGFSSIDEAADTISQYLPHRSRRADTTGLQKNLKKDPDGRYRWHWDPRFIKKITENQDVTGGDRLANAAKNLTIPTLLIRGKISDIVSQECADEFRDLVPHADHVDVSGAGHMVAGDSNDIFTEAVANFLEAHHPKS